MVKKYTPKEIDKTLQSLPDELKEAIFSMETADIIWQACEKQKIMDDRMTKTAEHTGHVLMGLIPPEDFQDVLEREVKIKKDTAKKIAHEINRFVFYPVKNSLAELHKVEVKPSTKEGFETSRTPSSEAPSPKASAPETSAPETTVSETVRPARKRVKSTEPDTYREPIE
ncbi:hypothetical protein ACFL11_01340 [Patescibacteria group bacterium]